jgi:hypothetical protein
MDNNKENDSPLEVILQRSFEAVWYQSEVLHKRTVDLIKEKIEAQDKRLDTLEKWNDTLNETIRDRIMMFSQDIIATLKDMMANLQATRSLHPVYCQPVIHNPQTPDLAHDHDQNDVEDPLPAAHEHQPRSLAALVDAEDSDCSLAP